MYIQSLSIHIPCRSRSLPNLQIWSAIALDFLVVGGHVLLHCLRIPLLLLSLMTYDVLEGILNLGVGFSLVLVTDRASASASIPIHIRIDQLLARCFLRILKILSVKPAWAIQFVPLPSPCYPKAGVKE